MSAQGLLLGRLRARKPCTGAWLFMGSPEAAELLSIVGFDALIIDHEHSPGSLETAIHQMRAIRAVGHATILVRLGSNDAAAIKLLLDCGAEGLMLPSVESADEARSFVAACRYPPNGRRGAHFTVSRTAGWGFCSDDYLKAESNLVLVVMIESIAGLRAIPDIARVDGISMLFIGPLDLSASAGKMSQWTDPAVISLLREAESGVLANGMLLGGATIPGDSAAECFSRGYSFVTVGSDVSMLRQGAIALVEKRSDANE